MAAKSGDKRRKTRSPVPGLELHRGKYRWRPMESGVRQNIPLAATTWETAIAEVLAIKKRPRDKAAGPWGEAVDAYIRAGAAGRKLSEATADTRRIVLELAGKDLDLASPRSLTPALARRWKSILEARPKISEGSLHDYFAHLRAFCKWCVQTGRMSVDPASAVELPAIERPTRDVFMEAVKVAELLADARSAGDRDMEFILALGCECGMRRGEIAACRPEWFDLQRGTVTIPASDEKQSAGPSHAKGKWKRKGRDGRRKSATIPLSSTMLGIIAHHGLPAPFVVKPEKKEWGKSRYRYEFKKRFDKFMNLHQVGHVTVHDLRRSFASNRVSAGVSIEKIANWMGIHKDTAWKCYSRFIPADTDINRGTAAPEPAPASPTPAADVDTIAARLAKLEALHVGGLISDEERAVSRAKILGEI